jgi:N-acetyl-anhydromuramyl-L-alanine amidase AmpD
MGGVVVTFIQGNQAHTSGAMGTVDLVVIHATVSPCKVGGARQNAAYFQSADAGGLAHYIVDPAEVVQACKETVACWHAPPVNDRAIGVELCDPQSGLDSRWGNAAHKAMLALAAPLFADICHRHNIPKVYVDHQSLLRGERGITTHHDVTLAWHKSTHTDPGPAFPMGAFITAVNGHKPAPAPQEDDMPLSEDDVAKVAAATAALLRKDIAVLLHGTRDGSHEANLDNIWKAVKK